MELKENIAILRENIDFLLTEAVEEFDAFMEEIRQLEESLLSAEMELAK